MNSGAGKDHQSPLHVLSADQFTRADLDHLYDLTNTIRSFDKSKEGLIYLKGLLAHKQSMLYFTQPSTRTFMSFQVACQLLGIGTCEIRDRSTSSERKGESIEDSLRTFSSYVDLIIMRSPKPGLCNRIAAMLDETPRSIPVINAGSGPDEHPTQALLDAYTLRRSFKDRGGIEGKTICFVGDIKRGRTVRSLARLLRMFAPVDLIFCSPQEFRMAEDLRRDLDSSPGLSITETTDFNAAIAQADAIYMTRIQDEYDENGESSRIRTGNFHLRYQHLDSLKQDCIIMHPMPRRQELDPAIDRDPRAKYWRQERNGMWTRVALITNVLGVDHLIVQPKL